ncbi:MAG: hypothetical protein RIT28_4249 [Pseudomonadota bacterium]
MSPRAVCLCLIGLSAPSSAFAQEAPPDALAATLRAAGLCDEAFLEYARLAATTPTRPDATLKAGEALWCAGRYDDAARYFAEARVGLPTRTSLTLGEAESLYLAGRPHDAALTLGALPSPDPLGLDVMRGAWITLRADLDLLAAADRLEAVPQGPLRPAADALAADLRAAPPIPHRAPAVAGALSAVLPGAGQLYAGAPKDGLSALLVNGALLGGAVALARSDRPGAAALTGVVGLSFYAGNIQAAVSAARRHNQRAERAALDTLAASHELTLTPTDEDAWAFRVGDP